MSILSTISSFIRTEILGIEQDTPAQNASQEKVKTPVIQCENVGKNEDFLEVKSESKTQREKGKQAGKLSLGALKENLKNLATKYGFTSNEFKPEGLIEKIVGLSDEEFEKLSSEDRTRIQNAVSYAMQEYSKMSQQGRINKDASVEKLTIGFGKLVYEALTSGAFKNTQDYAKAVGDIEKELGENFKKLSLEEQRTVLEDKRIAYDKNLTAKLAAANNLPEEEREDVKNNIKTRYRFVQRGKYMQLAASQKSETAMNGIVLLSSDDITWGAKTTFETRSSVQERTETADYADFGFTKGLLKSFSRFGDEIKPDSLESFVECGFTYKSSNAVNKYQKEYAKDRDIFENIMKKRQNGEQLTAEEEEFISGLDTKTYTAFARGIGEGALNNVNMTSSEKAEFISYWEKTARNYSDYEIVTQGVKNSLAANPEYKEIAEKIENIKLAESKKAGVKQGKTAPETPDYKTIQTAEESSHYTGLVYENPNITSEPDKKVQILKPEQKSKESTQTATNPIKKTYNPIEIAVNVKEYGVEEAIENYGKKDVITAILDNNNLKHLRPLLATIIKSYDKNTIKDIAKDCSDSAFVYICSIVDMDMIDELKTERPDLCFATRNLIEKMEENYEAA